MDSDIEFDLDESLENVDLAMIEAAAADYYQGPDFNEFLDSLTDEEAAKVAESGTY